MDGDGPAAYRYTEARLSKISGELLKDLGEYALKPEIKFENEFDKKEMMNMELVYFGFYLQVF